MTHAYGNRTGIRYLSSGVKVYYLPQMPMYNQSSMPSLVLSLPYFRYIMHREQINIVHSHQAFSALGLESLLHSSLLGYKTCFTDHSLFGFSDASSIVMNKILKVVLSDCKHVICVSNTWYVDSSFKKKF